jgi:hypothetical protein
LQALQVLGQVHLTRLQQGHLFETLRVLLRVLLRLVERFLGDTRFAERFLGEARLVLRFGDAIITRLTNYLFFV